MFSSFFGKFFQRFDEGFLNVEFVVVIDFFPAVVWSFAKSFSVLGCLCLILFVCFSYLWPVTFSVIFVECFADLLELSVSVCNVVVEE